MKNGYEIFWTDHATQELTDTIDYIEHQWSEKEIRRLASKIEETLSLISNNPNLFQCVNEDKSIHKAPVLKVNTLYYLVKNDKIFVLSFFSNRKNPKHLLLKN